MLGRESVAFWIKMQSVPIFSRIISTSTFYCPDITFHLQTTF